MERHINCLEKHHDLICEACPMIRTIMVSHPGGSSVHSVEQKSCEEGWWEEDF